MPQDLDIRLLRHFVAVAEDLNFTRAATRLFVAQQALSRDVRTLETRLGHQLLQRTSRQVSLTPEGQRFLGPARALVHDHDQLLRSLQGAKADFVVDIVGEHTLAAQFLATARQHEDGFEFYARPQHSRADSIALLRAGELDAVFTLAVATAEVQPLAGLRSRPVGAEALGLLLPDDHPLAAQARLDPSTTAGLIVCNRAGSHVGPDWVEFTRALLADRGAQTAEDHPPVRGVDELTHHVRSGEPPVLVPMSHPVTPGAVIRPLVDPTPAVTWWLHHRIDHDHPGLAALALAIARRSPRPT